MGYTRSEHLTLDEAVVRDGADLLPAVEDAELAVVLLDADAVAGQAAADQDGVALERDLAAGADAAGGLAVVVGRLGQRRGTPPLAGPPAFGGRAVAQGLVRAQDVVDAAPAFGVL